MNTKKALLISSLLIPSVSFSANLTLYPDMSFYGNKENKNFKMSESYISVPKSILPDTFIANITNFPNKIIKKEFQRNDIYKLLKENIGTNVSFNKESYKLKDVYNDFLILEKESNNKIIYAKFSKIDSIELDKNIPLKEGIFKITTDAPASDAELAYSYAFNGMNWQSNHKIFIDSENNIDHLYNLTINNNTDIKYNNVNLSLLSGDIKIGNNYNRIAYARNEMLQAKRMDIGESNFESFSGFQKLVLPEPVSIDASTKTELKYKEFKNFPNEFEYSFNTLHKSNQTIKNIHPDMSILLKRKENKKYQFPFTAGKISVYKLNSEDKNDYSLSTIINSSNIKDFSSDEDVIINLGKSYDVYMQYNSKKKYQGDIFQKSVFNNQYRKYSKNTYSFDISITNNEPNKVKIILPFNGSENFKEPVIKYIDGNSTETYNIDVIYEEPI